MTPYRSLLIMLLPLLGCPPPKEDTADTAADTDTDTTDTDDSYSELGCYTVPEGTTECPDASTVPPDDVLPATCGATVLTVDGAGTLEACPYIGGFAPMTNCMYPITVDPPTTACDYGRPLVIEGAPQLAPLVRRDDWRHDGPASPRAEAWARIALAEHASIASFSKFALELCAFGAPADLVADAHTAALDEVRHAKLAFGLAGRVGPGPLPMGALALHTDLASFAAATVREGCIAETLSALQMAEAVTQTDHPGERAAIFVIARDEARHSALAWRTVRWALEVGGAPVRDAVVAALAGVHAGNVADGLLPPGMGQAIVERGLGEVVHPAAAALLRAEACATA
jgi:hypothetical protein